MSDTPQWPDWWRGSDGKWYPPVQGNAQPLPPVPPESPKDRKMRLRRARVRAQVQALLEPGEQIQAMFVSQTGPSPRGALTWVPAAQFVTRYWNVAVTDRNIVCSPVEAFAGKGSKRFLRRLPREPFVITEGPSQRWWFPVTIGGDRHWVSREQAEIVAAANESLRATQGAPVPSAATAPTTPEQSSAPTPAAWYPDPSRRHQVRYWDGHDWTADVADRGLQTIDPVKAA